MNPNQIPTMPTLPGGGLPSPQSLAAPKTRIAPYDWESDVRSINASTNPYGPVPQMPIGLIQAAMAKGMTLNQYMNYLGNTPIPTMPQQAQQPMPQMPAMPQQGQQTLQGSLHPQHHQIYEQLRQALMQLHQLGIPGIDKVLAAVNSTHVGLMKGGMGVAGQAAQKMPPVPMQPPTMPQGGTNVPTF